MQTTILVAGFSPSDTQAIIFLANGYPLAQKNDSTLALKTVKKSYTHFLSLDILHRHKNLDALVINPNSFDVHGGDTKHKAKMHHELKEILQAQPSLLITKQNLDALNQDDSSGSSLGGDDFHGLQSVELLQQPCDAQTLKQSLFSILDKATAQQAADTPKQKSTAKPASKNPASDVPAKPPSQKARGQKPKATAKIKAKANTIDTLDKLYQCISSNAFLHTASQIAKLDKPSIILIDKYQLIYQPKDESVYVRKSKLEHIKDMFVMISKEAGNHHLFKLQALPAHANYDVMVEHLAANDHIKLPWAHFLWLIDIPNMTPPMQCSQNIAQIKITKMPNFGSLSNIPLWLPPILSSCLNQPRAFSELIKRLPNTTEQMVGAVVFLGLLDGVIDPSYLYPASTSDAKTAVQIASKPSVTQDDRSHLQPTSSTVEPKQGLIARLLSKLNKNLAVSR